MLDTNGRTITRFDKAHIDAVDRTIIRYLQEDGRIAFSKLAPRVGLSPEAVRQRVNRLLDEGIVQIVGVTDPLRLGFAVHAWILIRASSDLSAVAERIAEISDIDFVVITTGRFDIMAEAICEDASRFLEVLNELRSIEGVASSEAFNFLRQVKGTFEWGTPGEVRVPDPADPAP